MNGFKMKTKNVKFTVIGSRCRQNLKVGRRRQRNVLKTCHKSCNSVISGVDVAVIVPKTPYFPAALIFNFSIKRWTLLSLHRSLPKIVNFPWKSTKTAFPLLLFKSSCLVEELP